MQLRTLIFLLFSSFFFTKSMELSPNNAQGNHFFENDLIKAISQRIEAKISDNIIHYREPFYTKEKELEGLYQIKISIQDFAQNNTDVFLENQPYVAFCHDIGSDCFITHLYDVKKKEWFRYVKIHINAKDEIEIERIQPIEIPTNEYKFALFNIDYQDDTSLLRDFHIIQSFKKQNIPVVINLDVKMYDVNALFFHSRK
jgi:hypothetical protein